jgi:TolB-like protein/DNA-binding winged helix-turn-helix (wHTH) protein
MNAGENFYRFDEITLDVENFCAQKNGQKIILTPRAFDVLALLIKNSGRVVEKQEIFDTVWKDTFVSDNALTKIIKEIRHVIDDDASHPRYIVTIPKRGYRFIGTVEEKFAQTTPEIESSPMEQVPTVNDKADEKTVEQAHQTAQPRFAFSKAIVTLSALGFIAILAFGGWLLFRGKPAANSPLQIHSIAVLPFMNESRDPEMEYLSDGVSESIINSLSQLSNIKVIARSSSFKYKSENTDFQEIGRALGVNAILTGRVSQRGDNLLISAELVNATDNTQIWGKQFSRRTADLITLQTELSGEIADSLRLKLTNSEQQQLAKRYTENTEAYQLYLKGRYHLDKRTADGTKKSIDYFQQAINLDPNYALAYAGLTDSYYFLNLFNGAPSMEAMPKAKAAALRAVEIDDSLGEAHASLGFIIYAFDWDWERAEKELRRAIQLSPNSAVAHHHYAFYLMDGGRLDEALVEMKRALEIDPLSVFINKDLGQLLYYRRQYDQAIDQLQKTLELNQNFFTAYFWLGRTYEAKGLYNEAIEVEFKKHALTRTKPETVTMLRNGYDTSGWKGYWRNRLITMQEAARQTSIEPYRFAEIYARLGDKEQTLFWLERAYHERSAAWITTIKNDPLMDSLHSDPQFQDLLRRIGFQP